jgi:hypothetical protein
MELLLIVLIILIVLGAGLGFAVHALWIVAAVLLVIFLVRFFATRGSRV